MFGVERRWEETEGAILSDFLLQLAACQIAPDQRRKSRTAVIDVPSHVALSVASREYRDPVAECDEDGVVVHRFRQTPSTHQLHWKCFSQQVMYAAFFKGRPEQQFDQQ